MADNLTPAGIRAVIENLDGYLRGADQMNRATAGVGAAVQQAADKSGRAAKDIAGVGAAAEQGSKGFGSLIGRIGEVGNGVTGLLAKLAPLAAAIGGAFAIGEGIHAVDKLGAEIFQLQKQTGLTAEEASRLKFAFEDTGVSLAQGERALVKFQRALGGVADMEDGIAIPTGKAMAKALFDLGVRTQDSEGKTRPLTDVLGDLAEQFKNMPDGIEKTSLATNLFGRSGKDLIPFLNEGRDGLKALSEEADALGLTLDETTVAAIRQNELAMKRFHSALEGISVQIGLIFIPALTLLIQVGTKLAVAFNEHVVKVLRIINGIFQFELRRAITALAPTMIAFFTNIGKAVEKLGDVFKAAFITRDVIKPLKDLPPVLRPIGLLVSLLAASFRKSLDQFRFIGSVIKTTFNDLRIAANIIRAVVGDYTNILRIAQFVPKPIQEIALAIFNLVQTILDLGQKLLNILDGPFNRFHRTITDLTQPGSPLSFLRTILNELAKVVVPALATAITSFIGVLAVGTVLGFANAVKSVFAAFGDLGPIKFAKSLIGDFIDGLKGTFKLTVDLAGDALEGIANIVKGIGSFVGKVFSFTVNAVGNAIEFVRGIIEGSVQELLNQHPLVQKVQLQTEGAPGVPGAPSAQPTVQPKVSTGALETILGKISDFFNNPVVSGALGTVFGAALDRALQGGVFLAAGRLLQRQLGRLLAIPLFADIPAFLRGPTFATLLVGAIETTINILRGQFKQAGFRAGFAIGGGIIGGILGSIVPGAGTASGALVGAAIGIAIADALTFVFGGRIIKVFSDFFGQTLPNAITKLPFFSGAFWGSVGAFIAVALVGGLIILPGLIFRELRKINALIGQANSFLARAAFSLGAFIAKEIARGVVEGARLIGRGIGLAIGEIERIVSGIPGFFAKLPGRIKDAISDIPAVVSFTFKQLPGIVLRFITQIPDIIERIIKGIPGFFAEMFSDIATIFQRGFDKLDDLTGGALRGIIHAIANFGKGVVAGFQSTWDTANEVTGGALNRTISDVVDKLTTLYDDVTRLLGTIVSAVTTAWNAIKTVTTTSWDTISNIVTTAFDGVATILGGVIDGIRSTVVGGFERIRDGINAALGGVEGIATGAIEAAGDAIMAAVHYVAGLIADVLQKINDAADIIGYIPGVAAAQDKLQDLINLLRVTGGTSTRPSTGGLSPSDIAVLQNVGGLASGTQGPLATPQFANVAEQGVELAFLRRGMAFLPAGSEVVNATTTRQLLSALSGLPALAQTASPGDFILNMPWSVDARGMDFESMRAVIHAELDRQLISSRSRATRAGAVIGSSIG